jgi:hypothetical protein
MNSDKNTPRVLGAAFLIVIVTSLLMETLLDLSGSISNILVQISENLTLMRIGIFFALVNSAAIVVLAVLLYTVLNKQNKIIALIALGWWLAEAIILPISKIRAFALIPLSLRFIEAGAPESSFYQTLGNFLYYGIDRKGLEMHMFFYCLGGILWFYLFYKSRYIPWIFAIWGMIAESVALIGGVLVWFDVKVNYLFFIQLLALELVIGLWLLIKGVKVQQQDDPASAAS